MNYLVYLNNYDIRPCKAQYLFWFYYMLERFPEALFVINNDYVNPDPNRWEVCKPQVAYKNPKDLKLKYCIVLPKFEDLDEICFEKLPSRILNMAVNYEIPSLLMELSSIIKQENIEAVITCCNNRSLERACDINKVPCIHTEQGPLRPPFFKRTAYFDFKGVNGNTEFSTRFSEFKKVADKVKVYPKRDLLSIICADKEKARELISLSKEKPVYDCGVAMQVDVDTNLIAYNNNVSQTDLLNMAIREHGNVLVRNHPLSSSGYTSSCSLGPSTLDDSKNSFEFISKCKKIWTINSSVGFEALLMGKEVCFEGDTPFKELAKMSDDELLLALNFAIFSYLVSPQDLNSEKYHEFRINCKDELELYNKGQEKLLRLSYS